MPKAAPNDGTGRVTVSWNCPYESYTIMYYNVIITRDGEIVGSKKYQVDDTRPGEHSPLSDRYIWNVPENASQGIYKSEIQIMTNEAGMLQLGAYVIFQVSDVGKLVITKYEDLNGNGKRDLPDERGLGGWQFQVISPTNETYRYTTDTSGNITIDQIATGKYYIKEIEQPGYSITQSDDIVVVVKGTTAKAEFGNHPIKPDLSIVVFQDNNRNGLQDPGDPPLPGIRFSVEGPESFDVTSDSHGMIRRELTPGTYNVIERLEARQIPTNSTVQSVELSLGDEKTLRFGVYIPPPAGFKVVVFNDINRNGARDSGESVVPGWEVRISGPEAYNASAVTDSTGEFLRQLDEGIYTITAAPRPEWIFSTPAERRVSLKSGEQQMVEFGVVGPQYIICYHDKNANGQQDAGEPGLANWIFDIKDASGNLVASRSTDQRGRILISDLHASGYTVNERLEGGDWYNTTPSTLTADVPGPDIYFGNDMYRKLRVIKFNDSNNNKEFDGNEEALSGWEFQVDGQENKTDRNGIAEFRVRANREYTVSESITSSQIREGWQNSTPREVKVFIKPDDLLIEKQFGNHKTAPEVEKLTILRSIVYHDENGDGSRSSGEAGIPNVSLQITNLGLNFAPVDRVITDANGIADYTCQEGRYSVELLLPDDWCSNMSIIKAEDVKRGSINTLEFGLVHCCDCCNCEYRYKPEKTNMTFRVEDENLIVRKSIDPWVLTPEDHNMCSGGLINYTITVSAKPRMGQADLVLSVDTSGSIIEADYRALATIDEGITSFFEQMQRSSSSGLRIGIVSWDSNIDESIAPTTRYTDVLNASHRLSANSQELTMYHIGMNESIASLKADPREDARKVVVFITDARNEYEPFITLPEPDVRVYVLLIGGVQMNDTYRMLQDLVSRYNGRIFMVNTSQDIVSALRSITSECLIAEGSIRDIEIKDTLPSYLRPITTGTVKGNLTDNMDGIKWSTQTLSWRIPALNYGDSWSSTFRVVFCWKLQSNVVLSEKGMPETSMVSYADPASGERKSIRLPEGTIWLENSISKTNKQIQSPGFGAVIGLLGAGCALYLRRRYA